MIKSFLVPCIIKRHCEHPSGHSNAFLNCLLTFYQPVPFKFGLVFRRLGLTQVLEVHSRTEMNQALKASPLFFSSTLPHPL